MTMSKRDRFLQAANALHCLQCPVCGLPLLMAEQGCVCGNRHSFNLNRKGCMNFLSAPVDSCYDAMLFEARERVFRAGCYLPVADAIDALLMGASRRVLDAGCGDGWYLRELLTRHPAWQGAGVDISRDAVLQAANQPCTALWCVADLRRLPFRDGSFDTVLDVLTPANYAEFRRVLTPDGLLIKVYPGKDYLAELRRARGMELYAEGQVEAYLAEHTEVAARRRVTVTHEVSPMLWRDFVWMTPLNQDLTAEEKNRLSASPDQHVTVDLHVDACRWRG